MKRNVIYFYQNVTFIRYAQSPMAVFPTHLQSGSVYIFGEPVATSGGHNKCFIRVYLYSVRQPCSIKPHLITILQGPFAHMGSLT